MAVLGLRFCARAFSSCGKWGPLFIAVRGPLTIAASLVAEHRLSNCGSRAQLLRGMWDLPRSGLEPVSPALAGRFSTTAPPGKPCWCLLSTFLLVVCFYLIELKKLYNLNINPLQFCFFFLILFIYLFLAVLGLRFCARAFSSCSKQIGRAHVWTPVT